MRLIKLSLVTLALAVACAAQATVTPPGPPGVKVYSFDWRTRYRTDHPRSGVPKAPDYASNDPILREAWYRERQRRGARPSRDPNRLSMPESSSPGPARRTPSGYESSLQLANTGAKTIKAVEWQHVFYADKEKRQELRRFDFRKEERVLPGEQKFVSQTVSPGRAQLANKPRQSVEITRIEYADGSAWERR